MTRFDMLTELASDQVNIVQDWIREERYEEVHNWLQPIFMDILRLEFADLDDEGLKKHYADQMGVDIPDVPT